MIPSLRPSYFSSFEISSEDRFTGSAEEKTSAETRQDKATERDRKTHNSFFVISVTSLIILRAQADKRQTHPSRHERVSPFICFVYYFNIHFSKKQPPRAMPFCKNSVSGADGLFVFEKGHGHRTRPGMGSDHAADLGISHTVKSFLPKPFAVLDIFKQQSIGNAGISEHNRP